MKKLNLLALGLVLFLALAPFGYSLTNVDKAFLEHKNLLPNPGAESGRAGYTASGGSLSVNTTAANVYAGVSALAWDGSATGQTLTGPAVTLPRSGQCLVKTRFLTTETAVPYELEAWDGTNVLATTTLTGTGAYALGQASFPCPTSGTVRWRARTNSSAGNPAIIYFDDLYLGQDYNWGLVAQAQLAGQAYFESTAGCTWARSSATLGAVGADVDCPGPTITAANLGTWQTTDVDLPRVTINNLPPGRYIATFSARFFTAASTLGCIAVSDGTNTVGRSCGGTNNSANTFVPAEVSGAFEYSTAGNRTFELFVSGTSGNLVQLDNNGNAERVQFTLLYFPNSAQTAARIDQSPAYYSGYHDSNCSWSTTSLSATDPTGDATCTFAELQNVNMGTVATTYDGTGPQPGITFTPPMVGRYLVLPVVSGGCNDTAGPFGCVYHLTDGNNNVLASSTIGGNTAGANHYSGQTLIGVLNVSSIASQTLKIRLAAGSTGDVARLETATISGGTPRSITWTVIQLDSIGSVVIPEAVTSNSTGRVRIEAARITNSAGTCAVASQTGSWVSIGSSATGACGLNFTGGIFSTAPFCQCTGENSTSTSMDCQISSAATTSGVTLNTRNDAGTSTNSNFTVTCVGLR